MLFFFFTVEVLNLVTVVISMDIAPIMGLFSKKLRSNKSSYIITHAAYLFPIKMSSVFSAPITALLERGTTKKKRSSNLVYKI